VFKVTDVDTVMYFVISACYDKLHVCAHFREVPLFYIPVWEEPLCPVAQKFCHKKLESLWRYCDPSLHRFDRLWEWQYQGYGYDTWSIAVTHKNYTQPGQVSCFQPINAATNCIHCSLLIFHYLTATDNFPLRLLHLSYAAQAIFASFCWSQTFNVPMINSTNLFSYSQIQIELCKKLLQKPTLRTIITKQARITGFTTSYQPKLANNSLYCELSPHKKCHTYGVLEN